MYRAARVMQNVMRLAKINLNTCAFGDGRPIARKFANAVGEIPTAAPMPDLTPLPPPFWQHIRAPWDSHFFG
jgi:hypothetical protein